MQVEKVKKKTIAKKYIHIQKKSVLRIYVIMDDYYTTNNKVKFIVRAKPAPSSIPIPLLHFSLDPPTHHFALTITKDSLVCIHPITLLYGLLHLVESLSAKPCPVNPSFHARRPSPILRKGKGILHSLTGRHMNGHQCLRHKYQITPQTVATTHPSLPGPLRGPGFHWSHLPLSPLVQSHFFVC